MARAIDANELLGIERLLDTDVVRQSKTASWLLDQVLHDIQAMPTLTPPNEWVSVEARPRICEVQTELYRLALSTYGAQAQTMMVMEEMAELQKELCKHARGKENRAQIAEEIADVQIMLEQMELLHDCEGLVAGFKAQKLDRLEKRLREG